MPRWVKDLWHRPVDLTVGQYLLGLAITAALVLALARWWLGA